MTLQTDLALELAQTYRISALREMANYAQLASQLLSDRAKECGAAHLQEAKAHMSDAQDFSQLAFYLGQMIVETSTVQLED